MPKKKQPLEKRLALMADDIQIGGDTNFRAMAIAVIQASGKLTAEQKRDMERLLSRANRLLGDLIEFWERHPSLETPLTDRGHVASH